LSPDLHLDLAERRSRLLHLVQFIADSGALSTVEYQIVAFVLIVSDLLLLAVGAIKTTFVAGC
jgi:hypothetical protein